MGRNAGSHADGNSFRTVYQKVGNPDRQDLRFLLCLIKIRYKIHHIFIQISEEHFLGQFFQTCFRVSHGSRAISLDGSEVSVSVHQSLSFFEILCHNDKRLIDGAVAVGMVFTHGISHDSGTFPVRAVITDPQLIHIVQGSSLYRLQAVAYIRQRTGYNDTHRIINIGFLHDLRIIGTNDILLLCLHFLLLTLTGQMSSSASCACS